MASIEGLLRGVYPPLSVGGGLSQTPITMSPSQSRIPETNNQKILEVTNKITVLLTGEVRGAGNSCNVEDDHFLDRIMEEQLPVTLQDGSRRRKPPEKYPHPLYTQDYTKESQEILHHHQVNDEMTIKTIKEEPEESYMRGDEWSMEREFFAHLPKGSKQEGYNTPHHYQDENLVDVKQEQKEHVRGGEPCKEEEISPHNSTEWRQVRNIQEQSLIIVSNDGIESENDITLDSSGVTIPHLLSVDTQKMFSCSECGSCFPDKLLLLEHERLHIDDKPYSCSECGRCVSERLSLIRHEQVPKGEKLYSCSECGKCFAKKFSFITHKRVHTGEKPYSCSECGKCFSQKAVLIRHERVHTGEKPYSCSECGKCFSQKAVLNVHKRVHTGEKPYSCSECGKCFTHKSNLIRHEQAHTGKNLY